MSRDKLLVEVPVAFERIILGYLEDMVRNGLYGDTREEVIEFLVRDGILRRVESKSLRPRSRTDIDLPTQ